MQFNNDNDKCNVVFIFILPEQERRKTVRDEPTANSSYLGVSMWQMTTCCSTLWSIIGRLAGVERVPDRVPFTILSRWSSSTLRDLSFSNWWSKRAWRSVVHIVFPGWWIAVLRLWLPSLLPIGTYGIIFLVVE